jgi:hypothetical protein
MNQVLEKVEAAALRHELSRRTKRFHVGFVRKEYQYFENIEAESEKQAIEIAATKIKDDEWSDYGNGPRPVDVCEV